ncbi:hypothetical protein ACIBQ1_43315 [Nonomuraea sp. NPDC050153]|uniref:hypothetical protein n=1 Tax=Nonomuraea sp. NPDC050153 TaxID=3364359 RepID=UPI00379DE583
MYTRAITALATTAAALFLASGPAVADDDWSGPEDPLCQRHIESLEFGFIVLPFRIKARCIDTDDQRGTRVTID